MSKTIVIDRAVVEQALDMFERGRFANKDVDELEALCDVLHAALEQPQVEQEPVAYVGGHRNGWFYLNGRPKVKIGDALYAAPQPPSQPLTEEEIRDLFQNQQSFPRLLKFIRVIEAVHGIGEQQ